MLKAKVCGPFAALVLAAVVLAPASPTQAATTCAEVVHYDAKHATRDGGGTVDITTAGLHLATPAKESRVRWTQHAGFGLTDLEGFTYKTLVVKDGDRGFAAPAVRVGLDTTTDGTVDTTLVYEPYWNGTVTEGLWQTWDAAADTAKWWWEEEPNNPQTTRAWSHYREAYPDAKVIDVSVGMGTWNEGAEATVGELSVSTKDECAVHTWNPSSPSPSPSESKTAAPSPSTSAPGAGGGLPVTGNFTVVWVLLAMALVSIGVLFAVVPGWRRNRFTA